MGGCAVEAKQEMVKADWECWKKKEKQFEQIHRPILFDLDDNDQEQARWDACTRKRCNADVLQMAKEMDMLPYFPSPSPSLLGSRTKNSAQRKLRGERRTNTGRTVSPDMGIGENLIKEVPKMLGASSLMTTIMLMIVMGRHALKVTASTCPVLTTNTRVVSLL
jgi:hypothetical protein